MTDLILTITDVLVAEGSFLSALNWGLAHGHPAFELVQRRMFRNVSIKRNSAHDRDNNPATVRQAFARRFAMVEYAAGTIIPVANTSGILENRRLADLVQLLDLTELLPWRPMPGRISRAVENEAMRLQNKCLRSFANVKTLRLHVGNAAQFYIIGLSLARFTSLENLWLHFTAQAFQFNDFLDWDTFELPASLTELTLTNWSRSFAQCFPRLDAFCNANPGFRKLRLSCGQVGDLAENGQLVSKLTFLSTSANDNLAPVLRHPLFRPRLLKLFFNRTPVAICTEVWQALCRAAAPRLDQLVFTGLPLNLFANGLPKAREILLEKPQVGLPVYRFAAVDALFENAGEDRPVLNIREYPRNLSTQQELQYWSMLSEEFVSTDNAVAPGNNHFDQFEDFDFNDLLNQAVAMPALPFDMMADEDLAF